MVGRYFLGDPLGQKAQLPYFGAIGTGEAPEVEVDKFTDSLNMTRTPHLRSTSRSRSVATWSLILATALAASACSLGQPQAGEITTIDVDQAPASATSDEVLVIAETTTAPPTTAASPSTVPPTTAATPSTTADAPSTTEPPVAGEPLDFGPQAGTRLIVVGVEHDDVLNFRVDPDPQSTIVATAGPLVPSSIVAQGKSWAAPSGVWWLVTIEGESAWANQRYLAGAGNTFDITAQALADLGSARFETLEDAGETVAAQRVTDSGPEPRFAHPIEPILHETGGTLVVDVLDLGDDSVKGERLLITVVPIFDDSGDEGAQDVIGVQVISVEVTPLCARGVSGGLCL